MAPVSRVLLSVAFFGMAGSAAQDSCASGASMHASAAAGTQILRKAADRGEGFETTAVTKGSVLMQLQQKVVRSTEELSEVAAESGIVPEHSVMVVADEVPAGKRCYGQPKKWGGLGLGMSVSSCKDACLALSTCKFVVLKRGSCSMYIHCSRFETRAGFEIFKKVSAGPAPVPTPIGTDCIDTESCAGFLRGYPQCKYPPQANCKNPKYFKTRCAKSFGFCTAGKSPTPLPTPAPTTASTPVATPAPQPPSIYVTPLYTGRRCKQEAKTFDGALSTPEQCAEKAAADSLCSGTFMFRHNNRYGCRCCTEGQAAGGKRLVFAVFRYHTSGTVPTPITQPTPQPTPTKQGPAPAPMAWPANSGVREVDPDFTCSPSPTTSKDSRCNGRGYYTAVQADLGSTLGIVGQSGCLQQKSGYQDKAAPLPDKLMPGKFFALTQDMQECQRFRIKDIGAECSDTVSCAGFLRGYPQCKYPPQANCKNPKYFKTRCARSFGFCAVGKYQLEGIDALGRTVQQNGVGMLGVVSNQAKDLAVTGPDASTLFSKSGSTYRLGGLSVEVIEDGSKAELTLCTRCDFPFHGRFCHKPVQKWWENIHTLIIVFLKEARYEMLKSKIEQYQQDLLTYEGKSSDVLLWDLPKTALLRSYRELRHVLKTEYVFRNIQAAFFLGDFPAAWANHDVHGTGVDMGTDPTIMSFVAFTNNQVFEDSGCTGKLNLPGGSLTSTKMDIALGVLNHGTTDEYSRYFDRLHKHRVAGGHASNARKQWSFNEGDWKCDKPTPLYSDGGHFCNDDMQPKQSNEHVYRSMVNGQNVRYEYYNARSHAWHGGLALGKIKVDELWGKPYSGAAFFNLFHCSASRYIERNLGIMMALSTQHGLASVGSTHPGAMLHCDTFEGYLKQGDSWGEAFVRWFNAIGKKREDWHTGIIIYGDPNVRMRGGVYRAASFDVGPSNSALAPSEVVEEVTDDEVELMRKIREKDEQLQREHASEDMDFDTYMDIHSSDMDEADMDLAEMDNDNM